MERTRTGLSAVSARRFHILLVGLIVLIDAELHAAGEPITLRSSNETNGGYFGAAVARVPDLDGDGVDDIVVGAPGEAPGGVLAAGRAYLFSGATAAPIRALVSPNPPATPGVLGSFGRAVAGVPDVNGDGRGDVLIGAPGESPGPGPLGSGRAYLFDGSTGALLREFRSPQETSEVLTAINFGASVAGVPDVDGDGSGDLLIGAPGDLATFKEQTLPFGRAYVFSGATGVLLLALDSPETPRGQGGFGWEVAGIDDLNGDQRGDLIAAYPFNFVDLITGKAGRVHVFSGVGGALIASLVSPNDFLESHFGAAVAAVPDVNGDGRPEFIVGEDALAISSDKVPRRVYMFNGPSGSLRLQLGSPHEALNGFFGFSVGGVPDMNGDAAGDVVVGAFGEQPDGQPRLTGRAYAFDGRTGALLCEYVSPNPFEGGLFGVSVEGLGDLNDDDLGDVVIGASGEHPDGSPVLAGRAYIFLSRGVPTPTPTPEPTPTPVGGFFLVINEIHADPHPTLGDANGDGVVHPANDEFVEIVNPGSAPIDLTGFTLSDNGGLRHVFPPGSFLTGRCAVVVFGGAAPTGGFGGGLVQIASTGSLGLDDAADVVVIKDAAGNIAAAYAYGVEAEQDQSITRDPDVTGPVPLIPHTTAEAAAGRRFSPGTRIDGSPFPGCLVQPILLGLLGVAAAPPEADLNGDGVVDIADLTLGLSQR